MAIKPKYTQDEAKARHYARNAAWNKENTTTINIRILPIDKARYAAYAQCMGLPLATMMRTCVERCIVDDNWTWEPTPEDIELIKADTEARRAKAQEMGEQHGT